MKTASLCALVAASVAGYGWFAYELRLLPDFELYTQGGLGFYPTPLGRLLGAAGPAPLALLSIVSAGAVFVLAGFAARRHGSSSSWAAAALLLSPATLYLAYAGVDPIALALLVVAYAGYRPLLFASTAVLLHLALVPFALLELYRRRPSAQVVAATTVFVGIPVLVALALTPYSGVVWSVFDPLFVAYGLLGAGVGILMAAPLWLVVTPRLQQLTPFCVGGLLCGLQMHVQFRYLLPALVLLSLDADRPVPWLFAAPASAPAGAKGAA